MHNVFADFVIPFGFGLDIVIHTMYLPPRKSSFVDFFESVLGWVHWLFHILKHYRHINQLQNRSHKIHEWIRFYFSTRLHQQISYKPCVFYTGYSLVDFFTFVRLPFEMGCCLVWVVMTMCNIYKNYCS